MGNMCCTDKHSIDPAEQASKRLLIGMMQDDSDTEGESKSIQCKLLNDSNLLLTSRDFAEIGEEDSD